MVEKIADIVKVLGYRKDIADLCWASDVCVSVSLLEELPVSVIEAMACGLLIVASDIRGHRDNVVDGENGFLFALGDSKRMCDGVLDIYKSMELYGVSQGIPLSLQRNTT